MDNWETLNGGADISSESPNHLAAKTGLLVPLKFTIGQVPLKRAIEMALVAKTGSLVPLQFTIGQVPLKRAIEMALAPKTCLIERLEPFHRKVSLQLLIFKSFPFEQQHVIVQ